jgi:hypothetical protein
MACHCTEEITIQGIRPLGCRENLAFKCPRLADPTHDPSTGKILNTFCCDLH